ncbi:MAG: mechanosensitive ion channel family protein [Beijerinckiaceae bacterium]
MGFLQHSVLRLLSLIAFFLVAAGAVAQQTNTPPAMQRVDQARATLDKIDAALARRMITDAELRDLRTQIDPLQASIGDVINEQAPRLAGIKARLDQLGPKPDDKAPPESATVTAERAEQQKLLTETDETLKRARLIAVQADQASDRIISRRRALFTSALFERASSLFAPTLWSTVARELPRDVAALRAAAGDFAAHAADVLAGWRLALFAALLLVLAIVYVPVQALTRRVLAREPAIIEPSRFRKVRAALGLAIVPALVPVAAVTLFLTILNEFDLIGLRLQPLVRALIGAVACIALAAGFARGLLAPTRPHWRLLNITDSVAAKLRRLIVGVACIVSATLVVEALNEMAGASVAVSVLTRGVGAMLVAVVLATTLYGIIQEPDDADECLGPRVVIKRDWFAPLRVIAWAAIVTIFGSVTVGYIALAAFIAEQIVWVACVGAALYLLLAFIEEAIAASFTPTSPLGRSLMASVGIRRESLEQIGILLSGALHVILFGLAALLVLAPWGIQSDDYVGSLRAAFFGFKIGDVTISLSSVATGILIFALAFGATRIVRHWLDQRYLPRTHLDAGLRNSISTSVGYVGFVIAAALSLAYLGLSFDKLAIVAGALSLGIGFGLQSIVNNFVSGLILLWERAIRVGDWIVVGDEQGFVRRINVRSTEIETFDRAMMIVPNSNLVTGIVKNWVRTDKVGRLKISLAVQSGADPEKIRELLLGAAKAQDLVLAIPAPQVLLTALEAAAYKYDLLAYVEDVETSQRVKSELNFEIHRRFKAANLGLGAPAATTIVELADLDRLEALVAGRGAAEPPRRAGGKS